MRVLLADGFLVYRRGMALVLSRAPGVTVAGEAAEAEDAVALATALHPDLVILAADIPGGALAAARRIKALAAAPRLVLLVDAAADATWYNALGAPADGYLPRSAGVQELMAACQAQTSPR